MLQLHSHGIEHSCLLPCSELRKVPFCRLRQPNPVRHRRKSNISSLLGHVDRRLRRLTFWVSDATHGVRFNPLVRQLPLFDRKFFLRFPEDREIHDVSRNDLASYFSNFFVLFDH
jgi:hypothetical protein